MASLKKKNSHAYRINQSHCVIDFIDLIQSQSTDAYIEAHLKGKKHEVETSDSMELLEFLTK